MTTIAVSPIRPDEVSWLLALNAANVPEVGPMDEAGLVARLALPHWLGIARVDGRPCAALLGFPAGTAYGSENYRWFDRRWDRFVYVDRVMVEQDARGLGVGRRLYESFWAQATDDTEWLFCEVNELPPNPASMAFHERLGFVRLGGLEHEPGAKAVAMLGRRLSPAGT